MIVRFSTLKHVLEERDYLRTQLAAREEHWQATHALLLGRYAELVDKMHAMVRDGYHPAQAEPEYTGPEPLDGAILEAISARALDRDTGRDMEAWARQQVALGQAAADIAHRIWQGGDGL